ncbi:MAG: hypothetical protein WAV86_07710 [Lutibacter sp.]
MKNLIKLLVIGLISTIIFSCGKNKNIINSESIVTAFFKNINSEDVESMNKIYPNISTFTSYYKSDSIIIKKSDFINDSIIVVSVENYFTNGFGKKSTKNIDLYLEIDSLKSFSTIKDSKGLTDFKESDIANFATKTGCILKTDTTDVQRNLKLVNAEALAYDLTLDQLVDFMVYVKVIKWSWESGYGGSASGKGIVKNNTSFNIPNVKYKIEYKDRNGNVITSDDGYVSYDKLNAGESKSFTFYTSYVGNASRASISLDFDEENIREYILKNNYEGNEYEIYATNKLKDEG